MVEYLIYSGLYILGCAITNRIRGGLLVDIFKRQLPDKWISLGLMFGLNVALLSCPIFQPYITYPYLFAVVLTGMWFMTNLVPWGKYFDIGLLPKDEHRKSLFDPIYDFFKKYVSKNETSVDLLTMCVIGFVSIWIFLPFAILYKSWVVVVYAFIYGIIWGSLYALDRLVLKRLYAEYMTGALYGIFMIFMLYYPYLNNDVDNTTKLGYGIERLDVERQHEIRSVFYPNDKR